MRQEIKLFYSRDWQDYELLDTGEGEKLERFGKYLFIRPCENAIWAKTLADKEWGRADGKFWSSKQGSKSGWKFNLQHRMLHKKWEMEYRGIKFFASPTSFRHLGFFSEQASHWDLIEQKIIKAKQPRNFLETAPSETKGQGTHTFLKNSLAVLPERKIKFLNLFGYTGVASLFALRAGAEVTHLDASKQTLNWAKENQKLNSLDIGCPSGHPMSGMRVIEDDVIKFLEREEKRGNKYDAVIMDPPKFGRGPKGEIWKIEKMLPKLLLQVRKILSDKPLFVILTSYATDSSALFLGYALADAMKNFKGKTEQGELCVLEKSNKRVIPLANTAVWTDK